MALQTEDFLKILAAGIPAVVDFGNQPAPGGTNETRPEQTAPADITDRDNRNPPFNFMGVRLQPVDLLIYGGIALGIVYTVRWVMK